MLQWHGPNLVKLLPSVPSCVQGESFVPDGRYHEIRFTNVLNRYFDRLMAIIIEHILGWDRVKGAPHAGGGLFGRVTAFYAATESQNSTGDLHAHMLVWIEGLPTSVKEYYELWERTGYRESVGAYAESVISVKLPHSTNACPQCHSQAVASVPFTQEAYKKPVNRAQSFPAAICNNCNKKFGGDEFLQQQITDRALQLNVDTAELAEDMIARHIASPLPLPMPFAEDDTTSLVFCKALLTYQNHYWHHSKSCFKPTNRIPKGNICRMFFPKESEEAAVGDDGRVHIERPIKHEYVNGVRTWG
jgi:hypothetical protein